MMHAYHQKVLTQNRVDIVQNLKVTESLLTHLRQDYTLTEEMQQEIDAKETTMKKASCLIDTLMRRGDKAFDRLIYALVGTDQDHLAKLLDVSSAERYIEERNRERTRMITQPSDESVAGSFGDMIRGRSSGMQPQPSHPNPMMVMPAGTPGFPVQYFMPVMPMMMPVQMTQKGYASMQYTAMQQNPSMLQAYPGQMLYSQPTIVTQPVEDASLEHNQEEQNILAEINSDKSFPRMVIAVNPASNLHLTHDHNVYPMRNIPRGRVLIINNRYFVHTKFGKRDGAEHDAENLKVLFEQLSFTVNIVGDRGAEEILDDLRKESEHPDHQRSDLFILFLMSHGNEGNIYGIDGKPVSIEKEITVLFDEGNCPALAKKPKVFFIQACQGSIRDSRYVSDAEDAIEDIILREKIEKLKIEDKPDFVPGYNKYSDIVMSYATVKGYLAWRRCDLGSWFVRCLVSVFSRRAHSEHLLDMLTEVNNLLSKLETSVSEGCSRQLAEKSDTLTKKVYFFPIGGGAVTEQVGGTGF